MPLRLALGMSYLLTLKCHGRHETLKCPESRGAGSRDGAAGIGFVRRIFVAVGVGSFAGIGRVEVSNRGYGCAGAHEAPFGLGGGGGHRNARKWGRDVGRVFLL